MWHDMTYDMKWNNMKWPETKSDGAVLYTTTPSAPQKWKLHLMKGLNSDAFCVIYSLSFHLEAQNHKYYGLSIPQSHISPQKYSQIIDFL